MKIAHSASLKTRLYILVLITALPGWALVTYNAAEQKQAAAHLIRNNALQTARLAANQERRLLEEVRHLLIVIGDFFLQTSGDSIQCQDFFDKLYNQSLGYANFGVVRPDGQLICSANPVPEGIDLANRHWFKRVKQLGDFAMGDYHLNNHKKEPVLYLANPLLNEHQKLVAVVFAALNLNWLNRSGFDVLVDLPAHSNIIQIDRAGTILSYDPFADVWSAQAPIDSELVKQFLDKKSGVIEYKGTDGIPRIFAFTPLAGPLKQKQIILITATERKIAFAKVNWVLTRNLSWLVGVTLLALVFVWKGSELFFLRQIKAMVSVSRQLAGGELSARIGPVDGQDELSQLARVFDEMATAMQKLLDVEKRAGEKIRQSHKQLRHLTNHLQKVREEERTRIARELHDQFGQTFSVLKMDLAWLAKHPNGPEQPLQAKLDSMGAVIDATLQVLHRVCTELRPVILDDFGLAAAIQWQAEDFQNRTGIACRAALDSEAVNLTQDKATAVFRIFQETLTNVLRHADATEINVHLWEEDDQMKLDISDNGKGIKDLEINNPASLGLIGMRERVYEINGTIQFSGIHGKGTRVSVAVPLN